MDTEERWSKYYKYIVSQRNSDCFTKTMVRIPDGGTNSFEIVAGVLRRDILLAYLFIIGLVYELRKSIDVIKENCFK